MTGTASEEITITERPDTFMLTVRYAGEPEAYNGSAETAAFIVDKEDAQASLASSGNAANKTLTATLVDEDDPDAGIAGRELTFTVDGREIGSARTDENGVATFQVPRKQAGGKREYGTRFPGDAFYRAAGASTG